LGGGTTTQMEVPAMNGSAGYVKIPLKKCVLIVTTLPYRVLVGHEYGGCAVEIR